MALILAYGINDDLKKERLKNFLKHYGFELKTLTEEDLDKKVGYLCELEGFESKDYNLSTNSIKDFEFLLLKDVPKEIMHSFLTAMQKENLYIEHKAGMTPTNINWTLRQLMVENDKEHEAVKYSTKTYHLVSYATKMLEEFDNDSKLKEIIKDVKSYYESPIEEYDINKQKELYQSIYERLDYLNKKYL